MVAGMDALLKYKVTEQLKPFFKLHDATVPCIKRDGGQSGCLGFFVSLESHGLPYCSCYPIYVRKKGFFVLLLLLVNG